MVVTIAVTTPKKMKIDPKMVDCIFIGYAHNSNVYRFLMYESKNSNIQKNTIMESRNAAFFEHVFPCRSKEGSSSLKQTYETMNEVMIQNMKKKSKLNLDVAKE